MHGRKPNDLHTPGHSQLLHHAGYRPLHLCCRNPRHNELQLLDIVDMSFLLTCYMNNDIYEDEITPEDFLEIANEFLSVNCP
mgnify:CR=1 FL=1